MKLKQNYKLRDIAGEKMLIIQGENTVDLTKVITLNSTSEWLWTTLSDSEFSQDTVSELLCEKFEIDKEKAAKDAGIWIESLNKTGLIEPS